jgi:hypothetical protein
VLVLPILNHAGLEQARIESITSTLVETLIQDGHVVIASTPNPRPSMEKTKSTRFGIVIDADQAKKAEQMGMNVLLSSVINPPDFSSRKAGIWPFRKVKQEAEISMVVNAFDVVTGTLFLSHFESEKVRAEAEILEEGLEAERGKPEVDEDAAEKALSRIAAVQASAVSNALREQPWSGRILSVGPEKVTISAGKDVGLSLGHTFEVFGQGESIRSAEGNFISPLGLKIGEIKVVEVMEKQALAIPVGNGVFTPGQVIRLKN